MDSSPALGLLGFWMMLQLMATLALLVGGIYVLFCLGRAASGLDRMANAMEDWIALQTAQSQPTMPQPTTSQRPGQSFGGSTPAPVPAPFTPAPIPTQPEYSAHDETNR